MGFIFRFIINWVKSAQRIYSQISPRGKLQLAILVGIIGLLVLGAGIYNTIDLTNKYNDLDSIPPPDPNALQQMSQADLMLVAQVGMAKRDLVARRAESTSVIGAGAIILGLATLVFVNIPEQRPPVPPAAPASPKYSAPDPIISADKSAEVETNAKPEKPTPE